MGPEGGVWSGIDLNKVGSRSYCKTDKEGRAWNRNECLPLYFVNFATIHRRF